VLAVTIGPPVSVVVDGRLLIGSVPARLQGGVVVAPLDPYAYVLARRIAVDRVHGWVTLERDGRSVTVDVASLRDGTPVIPLGRTARALGDAVRYDAAAHSLEIESPVPRPLATLTPFAGYAPPPGPLPTFPPVVPPTPRPTVSGIPQPRRTPIVVGQ